jgi:DNA primase
MLLEEGLRVGVVELPEGHDPDSFLKAEGAAAYRGRLEEAPEVMEWLIRRGLAENDVRTPAGKAAFAGAILPALSRIDNAVERAAWVAQIATRGGLDLGATETELRRIAAAGGADRQPAPSPPPVRRSPMLRAEHWLLALALQGAEGSREALLELSEADIDGLAMEEALRAARSLAASGAPLSTHALLEAMASAEAQKILREIEVAPPPTGDATPQDCVRELRGGPLRVRMADIQKRLPGASGDDLDRLLREKTEILQRLANL